MNEGIKLFHPNKNVHKKVNENLVLTAIENRSYLISHVLIHMHIRTYLYRKLHRIIAERPFHELSCI